MSQTGWKLGLLILLSAGVILAQTAGTGTLVGTITDSTGAVMVNATVTVTNVATSFVSKTVTSAAGSYYVPYLAPGTYRLTVEGTGFKRYVSDGIQVSAGEVPRIDVKLEVGAMAESVTVTAVSPLLETETSSTGQIFSGDELTKMPINEKRVTQMLYYYEGTNSMSGFHVLGQRQNMIGFTLDGVEGKEPGIQSYGGTDTQLSAAVDAFEEVKVYTTGTPAEIGHSAGGLEAVIYRSGTNQLHGSAEDQYIDKVLIHRSVLEQTRSPNPFSYHEMSFVASGPVVLPKYNGRDKTFWLFGFQRHQELGATEGTFVTVPTPDMYNGDFSFNGQTSPKPLALYNPYTTRLNGTTWVRDPFPGNIVPKSLFDPVAEKFLSLNPFSQPNLAGIPSATGPTSNLDVNPQKWVRRTRWDVKFDHQFTPNHKVSARYSQARHRTLAQTNQFSWVADPTQAFSQLVDPAAVPTPIDEINIVLSDTMILSSSMNNEFRVGYNRRALYQAAPSANQNWAQQLGIPNVSGATFPNFNIGYGLAGLTSYHNIGDDITVQDNFTKIEGKHTIKFGYELVRTRYNATSPALPSGNYTFGGTEAPFTPNTGNTLADFLLGTVTSATFTQGYASWLPRWLSHQAYIQDDWKALPSLTLNLGLRYDYETPFETKYGQNSQFDPNVKDPVSGLMGAIVHQSGPLARADRNNFEPRLGLAWNFAPKWAFRSSFGVIHADIFAPTQNINFDEYLATATIQAAPGDPNQVFRLSQGPPSFAYSVQPNGTVPFVGTNYSSRTASWWDPGMRMPYVLNWAGGVQWEFAHNWLMEMNYQGQSGVGLINSWNMNAIPLNVSTNPAVLTAIYKATQNYLPYPQFGSINAYSNYGHNTHHSGTLRVERRFTSGVALNAFYTYQKTLSECDAEGTCTGITYYNRSLEKARTAFDTTHRFVSVLTYQLPFGKGRRWMNKGGLFNQVLGGWELTETQTLQSGTPFTVSFSGSPYQYLPGSSRPNIVTTIPQATVQGWSIGPNRFPTSAQNPYLNFSSFAYPAAFTAGDLGRNTFEGPGLNWMQVSLAKWWKVKERYRFQLRFDGYNWPIEEPNYANPSSAYNVNSPGTFARMTGVQGSFSGAGAGRPNMWVIGRFEF
ncbi:MAG TPA: TonB-dependent receptor [Bryobacteraceae bacterium]|nr:TonB-dependent receptor [Bryobacteraceae bacterium]